jgi:large repetitive protein
MRNFVRASLLFASLLFGASAFAQSHTVTLSWTPAQQPSGITIASWNVLRGTTSGGPYTQLANVVVGSTSYADSAVSSGSDYYYVVEAVDTQGVSSANSAEVEAVIPTSAPPLAVATSSLPPATVGTSYSTTITASGGTGPYTWSGTGVDGLTFSSTGLLSGTPSAAGSFTQGVTVKDSAGNTANASLPLSVSAALAITTTSLPPATAGASYSTTITASGGTAPYSWSGTGVDGLTLNASGVLSGTPSAAGTFTQSVTVKDSAGNTASASLSLSVAPRRRRKSAR